MVRFALESAQRSILRDVLVNLYRIRFAVENGMSSTTSVASHRIPVAVGTVRDLKFIDDRCLMLAFVGADGDSLLHGDPLRAADISAQMFPG